MPDLRVEIPTRPTGPGVDWDEQQPLEPARDLEGQIEALSRAVANLAAAGMAPKRQQYVEGVASHSLDSDGRGVFPIYKVGAGFYFKTHRLCVEATGYTPASPYLNANFYLLISTSTDPIAVGQGGLVDFYPTTSGAPAGEIQLPAVAEYSSTAGPLLRNETYLVCTIVGGPASTRITVHYQGLLEGVEI